MKYIIIKIILFCMVIGPIILLSIGYQVFGYGQWWEFSILFSVGWIGGILVLIFCVGTIGMAAFDMISPTSHYNRAMNSASRYLDSGSTKDYNEFYDQVSKTGVNIFPGEEL